jgi:hypothetical protein
VATFSFCHCCSFRSACSLSAGAAGDSRAIPRASDCCRDLDDPAACVPPVRASLARVHGTANATTPYYLGFADLFSGPLVLTMPPRGVQGAVSDAWQIAIPGTEEPGTYLMQAPGQQVPDDVAGYSVRQSPAFNIFLGVRLTDGRSGERERGTGARADLSVRAT